MRIPAYIDVDTLYIFLRIYEAELRFLDHEACFLHFGSRDLTCVNLEILYGVHCIALCRCPPLWIDAWLTLLARAVGG